jgi:serine/threonine protein kinase
LIFFLYFLLFLLGKGGYGTVYLCKEKATGAEYAVKQIEIKKDIQKLTSRSDIPKAISRELCKKILF